MPISDLCSQSFVSVERNATLQYAAQLMKQKHVGGLVVVDSNGKKHPAGVLTDRDIVLSVVAENLPLSTKVSDIMSTNVVKVKNSEGIAEVVDTMEREGVRRVVVVDDTDNVCGLATSDDVLELVAREIYGLGRVVQKQIQNETEQKARPQVLLT